MNRFVDYPLEVAGGLVMLILITSATLGIVLLGDHEAAMREQARRIAATRAAEALQGPVRSASYEYEL